MKSLFNLFKKSNKSTEIAQTNHSISEKFANMPKMPFPEDITNFVEYSNTVTYVFANNTMATVNLNKRTILPFEINEAGMFMGLSKHTTVFENYNDLEFLLSQLKTAVRN